MNLHEECLLKYLSNPLGIYASVELLKINNALLSEDAFKNDKKRNFANLNSGICRN
ncbi:hypothetical protein IJO12_02410 [bacterium]|nr:hypothetical protein [bacterium]